MCERLKYNFLFQFYFMLCEPLNTLSATSRFFIRLIEKERPSVAEFIGTVR